MNDADDESRDDSTPFISRRTMIAATAGSAVGMTALAGCTGEEDGGGDGEALQRPTADFNTSELDPVLQFLVASSEYQNRLLEREFGKGGGDGDGEDGDGDGGGE